MKSNDQISIDEPNMHALDTTMNTANYRDTAEVYLDKSLFSPRNGDNSSESYPRHSVTCDIIKTYPRKL